MRFPEPRIETRADSDGVRIVARYETPETARLMRSAYRVVLVSLAVLLSVTGWIVVPAATRGLVDGQVVVAQIVAVAAAFGLAQAISGAALDRRFGARGLTDRVLVVELRRTKIVVGAQRHERQGRIAFTSTPHRDGRAEDRAERVSGEILPEIYRRAHSVHLQVGERFVVLAEVSDDDGANAIVRRLQAADEWVTRGQMATDGPAFGLRQAPE